MAAFTDIAVLDAHMRDNTYIEGYTPTQADVSVFKAITEPGRSHKHALRWFKHIKSFDQAKLNALPGKFQKLAAAASAPAPAETPKKEKAEKAPKAPKEPKEPKEKEAKKEPAAEDPDKAAKEAAKARDKLLKAVIKEGGKKGVEIEGASDMGGLDFFCTNVETPEGDMELLQLCMTSMNSDPDPEAEDRKGCSGHVGKMIFSVSVQQLSIVSYVPADKLAKVDITEWTEAVCAATDGKVTLTATDAKSPKGGKVMEAVVLADPDKGKFPLKDKDTAMAAAFTFLRSKDAFPEDKDDDDDDCCFGDDAFDNIDEL